MQDTVTIVKGTCYKLNIENQTFPLVAPYRDYSNRNGGFVTVQGDSLGADFQRKIRISVDSQDDVKYSFNSEPKKAITAEIRYETDEEIIARIAERFSILDDMTFAAAEGEIRSLLVRGAPGVGKSFGVLQKLKEVKLLDTMQGLTGYEVVKGTMSALGLYAKLYELKSPGQVVVFDDCSTIFSDDAALDILLAALDTNKKRTISWNSDSHLLRRSSIPNKFDFEGSAIFITNLNFDNIRSEKMREHLAALESRCHFLDLTLTTRRDCLLRIKQIAQEGTLFKGYNFSAADEQEIIDFIWEHQERYREVSLRQAIKTADLKKSIPHNWQRVAKITLMKN